MSSAKTRNDSVIFAIQSLIPEHLENPDYPASRFVDELQVKENDTYRPLFVPSLQTMNELIEVGMMFEQWGLELTFNYLKNKVIPELEEMYQAGTPEYFSTLIFNSNLVEDERLNEEAMLIMNADLGPLTDMVSCHRCGTLKVRKKMAQTRSADEGVTAIFTCPTCGFTWNQN
jgi:DNA-directed RNA polymerase subunit M/transcription elongation factor TFIIS